MEVVALFKPKIQLSRTHFQYEVRVVPAIALAASFYAIIGASLSAVGPMLKDTGWSLIAFYAQLGVVAIFSLIFAVSIITVRTRLRRSARSTQHDRNQFAAQIIANRGIGAKDGFALYLRPFIIDGQIKSTIGIYRDEIFSRLLNDDFENAVTQAVDRRFPVVALGGERMSNGPGGGAAHDDEWQETILDLMGTASLILVVPIAEPSTLWEIKQIHFLRYLHKTVFIVPPLEGRVLSKTALGRTSLRDLYEHSHERFKREGIPMPRMGAIGGIFWLHQDKPDLKLWRYRFFRRKSQLSFRTIRKIILEDRDKPLGPKEVITYDLDRVRAK